jgi:hypothetical protein
MKRFFFGLKPVYQIVILDLLGGFLISAVLRSNILTDSKISLSVIIGVVIGIAIIFIYQRSAKQEQESHMKRMDERFEGYFIRLKELAEHSDAEQAEHCAALERETAECKQAAAMFPLAVAKGYEVYAVVRKAHKPFYDSDWLVSGEHGGELFACHITRRDDETAGNLIALIRGTESPDGIWALDEYAEIYPEEDAA